MSERGSLPFRSWQAVPVAWESRDRKLVDQFITVRVLSHVVSTLVLIAAAGWWFLFDEVKSLGQDVTAQRTELLREVSLNGQFQIEQRMRLWDRVNELQHDIQALQVDVGELRASVQHVGRTTDAILSAVTTESESEDQ